VGTKGSRNKTFTSSLISLFYEQRSAYGIIIAVYLSARSRLKYKDAFQWKLVCTSCHWSPIHLRTSYLHCKQ